PSADRVPPPCEYAGPGGCGGCDWQHASGAAQLELKAAVVREALARLGGLPGVAVAVQPLPGGVLGWRTPLQVAVDDAGRLGLRRHGWEGVELLDACPWARAEVKGVDAPARLWPGAAVVEVVAPAGGQPVLLETPLVPPRDSGHTFGATRAARAVR